MLLTSSFLSSYLTSSWSLTLNAPFFCVSALLLCSPPTKPATPSQCSFLVPTLWFPHKWWYPEVSGQFLSLTHPFWKNHMDLPGLYLRSQASSINYWLCFPPWSTSTSPPMLPTGGRIPHPLLGFIQDVIPYSRLQLRGIYFWMLSCSLITVSPLWVPVPSTHFLRDLSNHIESLTQSPMTLYVSPRPL